MDPRGDQAMSCDGDDRTDLGGQAKTRVGGQASSQLPKLSQVYRPTEYGQCSLCSYKQLDPLDRKRVVHKHFSSKFCRECAGSGPYYFCPTCKSVHTKRVSDITSRLKIVISSSTMHEFWAPREASAIYEGDSKHTEYVTIPGAQVLELMEAWKIDYFRERRGMDLLVVAGLNNIKDGQSPESLMRDLDHFVQTVKFQSKTRHPDTPNTCAIATMFYPPQLCWLPDTGPCPSDFVNHYEDMKWINAQIEKLNGESNLKVPNFTTFGVRVSNKSSKNKFGEIRVRHTTTHRWENWRENDPRGMLHLSDSYRMKMGRWVGRYFLHETSN